MMISRRHSWRGFSGCARSRGPLRRHRIPRKRLGSALGRLRRLTLDPEEARHVPRILMECGIRFIVVESLPGAKIDGVCFWLGKALL